MGYEEKRVHTIVSMDRTIHQPALGQRELADAAFVESGRPCSLTYQGEFCEGLYRRLVVKLDAQKPSGRIVSRIGISDR
jgi:hypothetical protein